MNVDWERINSFIDEENEEERDWLKDMIGTLISNYEERLAELNEIIKKQDNEGLISLLHQMKGITANRYSPSNPQSEFRLHLFSEAQSNTN
jgi:HPt (histidine-containing phosphotransfer) domain-containing protein